MNKKSLLSLCLFGASMLLSFVTMHVMSLFDISKWVGVSVGLALFIIMFVLVAVFKRHMAAKIAALIVNPIADGLAISSLFVHLGAYPPIWQTAVSFSVLFGSFLLYLLLTYLPFTRRHYIISMLCYVAVVLGVFLTVTLTAEKLCVGVFALTLIYFIVFISYFVTLAITAYDIPEHIMHIAYCTFVALALVIIVVLIVISQGDCGDGCDCGGGGGGGIDGGSKKRNPYALE